MEILFVCVLPSLWPAGAFYAAGESEGIPGKAAWVIFGLAGLAFAVLFDSFLLNNT
jgi:hypothetical protein